MRTPPWLEEQINQLTEEERGNQSVAEFISSFTGITFYIHSWDRDKKTGTVIRSNKKEMGSSRQINDVPDIADIRRQAFKSVSGRFATIYPRKQFVLWPLKYTPKYHVIYEIDDSKLYTGRTDPDEDIRKQKQHDRYLKSLPREKPGKAIKGEL